VIILNPILCPAIILNYLTVIKKVPYHSECKNNMDSKLHPSKSPLYLLKKTAIRTEIYWTRSMDAIEH
jgi:hypothetical protein